jgi:FkbM family methyltransferase
MSLSRDAIGLAMRLYRGSPLHPRFGAFFARLLSLAQRRTGLVTCRLDGFQMELDLSEVVDAQIYYTGVFEPRTLATIDRVVRPGDVAVDVGANVGFLTLRLAARVGGGGTVYAFEPTTAAFARLQRNLALNALPQIRPVQAGLSDREGSLRARIQHSYRIDGRDRVEEQEVTLVTLDGWAAREGLSRLAFLKIDTDGMEAHVLRGGQETLRRLRPVLSFELVPQALQAAGESAERLVSLLEELGYRLLQEATLAPWPRSADALEATRRGTCVNVVAWPTERPLPGPAERRG